MLKKKNLIGVKIFKYLEFIQNFPKIPFSVKIFKITILVKIFEKSQVWSKISKNLDFGQNWSKYWF